MIECRIFTVVILLGLLSVHSGCNRETSISRYPVHGSVTTASGEQLNGFVTFIPAEGNTGPAATAKLENGKYEFDQTNGPILGPHSVIIKRLISRSDSIKASTTNPRGLGNTAEWTFSVNVANDGKFLQDFNLDKK